MKKWWKKVREFFARPKVIKWTIVILTVLIIVGALKALVWTIYTKDKPAFVPEEVREDIRGAIKDSGEAIKTISNPVGTAIVDASFVDPAVAPADPTESWPIYTDAVTGISMKYPEGWQVFEGEGGATSFVPRDKYFDGIYKYGFDNTALDVSAWWIEHTSEWSAAFAAVENKQIGKNLFYIYKETDGMMGIYYVAKLKTGKVIYFSASGEGNEHLEKMLATIS